ncbi:DNA-formamidopyrimidine glycosylase family protein [Streptomyces sp. RFCAC02]|uniref:Fpg/Nei family DNA glycosylase n=1 Tax=Streptomyces sp. RFCAC02 TaxID=2499143 RepID=UPI0010223602|nr:DNA-formamidopyrimidine glycosylase family protein [Streptomyces sp. RFCAC02]
MPELPDVEGFRRVLRDHGTGRRVERLTVRDDGVLREVSTRRFRRAVRGRCLGTPERHGKWLIAPTDAGPTLLLHFGMTGRLVPAAAGDPLERADRVVFGLSGGGELRFRDQRKLRGIWLAPTAGDIARLLAGQGPDAAAVGGPGLVRRLARRRGGLKSALLDQSVVAGLGNLLADELLWRARLHPARRADGLTAPERRRLAGALPRVLDAAVAAGRVPPRDDWLTGRRDDPDGGRCPRTGDRLARGRVAGRTTVWCPRCQPAPDR